jgi:class 3 adenylate cyclase/tetratricopeptide (TPR) repeat protein
MAQPAQVESQARKIVTVVFSDLTESTRLGEQLDPESVRRLVSSYFDEMKSVLEKHGGVVEKFIGDAVMAVFGVPRAHEDDALRAVRAAVEMREALQSLNAEFERTWGVTIAVRTGVNTGEVIAGDPSRGQSFVVGDAVNTASGLEHSAGPGEIIIGEATYRLVREAVMVEETGPLLLKGKSEPVRALKVVDVIPSMPGWTRSLDSPLVARERELVLLQEILARAADASALEVVTLIGAAGVGKSRLISEFVSRVGAQATVITGRCLPYGEGITFWPIASVLRDAAGIDERDPADEARPKLPELLRGEPDAALVADRLLPLLGIGPGSPGIQETFWAVRKLFAHLASQRPLVVVFDDIHWGEETFLELLEYLAEWIRTAPVMLLCLARPELLEVRPGWMMAKSNAALISLEPLTEPEIDSLIQNLVGGADLAKQARSQIAAVAEGNPLFIEETLRMLVDDGLLQPVDGKWTVRGDLSGITIPPTIHALLTARLDRLEGQERAVIERASVVGRLFWWRAVTELSPPEVRPRVILHLQSLMRKELIRPDYSETDEEASFRFAHILILDAAYQGIPKTDRAELHERLADYLEAEARDLVGEYEEVLGYHLEQAALLLLELGSLSERTEALSRRAAGVLISAGRRAFARGDMPAAAKLFSRAASLLREEGPERAELLPQLAFALFEIGDFARLQEVVAESTEAATASGNPHLEAYALILGLWIRLAWNPEGWAETAEREATTAISAFEAVGDKRGLAKAWALLGLVHIERAHFSAAEEAWEKAARHAHGAGDRRDELESMSWIPLAVWAGPTDAERGLARCRDLFERAEGDKKVMASALIAQAAFEAGLGRFDEARDLVGRAKAYLEEVALTVWRAGPLAQLAGWIELLAGDPSAADRELRWGYDKLTKIGELSWLSTLAAILAEAVHAQGRHDEAAQLASASEDSAGSQDAYSHALSRSVRAKVLARGGDGDAAERLAKESVALGDTTDFLHLRWHTRMSYAEVLRLGGRGQDAGPILDEAIRIAEEKGSLVGAQRARDLCEDLEEATATGTEAK